MSYVMHSALAMGLLLGIPAISQAAPPGKTSSAWELVEEALKSEIQGNATERANGLNQAIAEDAQYAPARWSLGQLNSQGKWVDFQTLSAQEAKRSEVQDYRVYRDTFKMTKADQIRLADWCRDNNLPLREQAHLTAALELSAQTNSSNPARDLALRARLGQQFINGVWMTEREVAESLELAKQIQQAANTWTPTLLQLARQIHSPRTAIQKKARAEFFAIDDVHVLPAMEAVFSTKNLQSAHLFVQKLAEMSQFEAHQFLARQAVLSPFVTVREEAAKALKTKPLETYAPLLLETLHTPIQSRVGLFANRQGIRLTHILMSEAQDVRQVAGFDSRTIFRNVGPISVPFRTSRGIVNLYINQDPRIQIDENRISRNIQLDFLNKQIQAYVQQRAVEEQNQQLSEWNNRVCKVLKETTGLALNPDPKEWWKWWEDYNQLQSPDEKPYQYVVVNEVRETLVSIPIPAGRHECLVAGTTIFTDQGFMPIEKIQVGDLVLSKHPRTGELAFQPVLKTTKRPASALVKATFGNTEITATEGHTFWVSGKGWQKIREIPTGSPFHTVNGLEKLTHRESVLPEPTYNLVVADFHTYFVGQAMLLSRDVTFAKPVNNTVPGLLD